MVRTRLAWLARAAMPLALVLGIALTPTAAHADARDFVFANLSNADVNYLYVAPSASNNWEADILGRGVMLPAEETNVTFGRFAAGVCLYDIKAVTNTEAVFEAFSFDLCSTTRVEFKGDTGSAFFYYYQ